MKKICLLLLIPVYACSATAAQSFSTTAHAVNDAFSPLLASVCSIAVQDETAAVRCEAGKASVDATLKAYDSLRSAKEDEVLVVAGAFLNTAKPTYNIFCAPPLASSEKGCETAKKIINEVIQSYQELNANAK